VHWGLSGGVILANSPYKHALESDLDPFQRLVLGLFLWRVGATINFQPDFENTSIIVGCNPVWSPHKSRIYSWHRQIQKTEVSGKISLLRLGLVASRWIFFLSLMHLRLNSEFGSGAIRKLPNGQSLRWVWPSHLFWMVWWINSIAQLTRIVESDREMDEMKRA